MQKLYHSISEVSELVDEEQHILRYWEKEFSQLKPRKNRGGNRIYSDRDLTLIKLIKKFLRHDKLSLKGAKEQLGKYLAYGEDTDFFGKSGESDLSFPVKKFRKDSKSTDAEIIINQSELADLFKTLKEASGILKS